MLRAICPACRASAWIEVAGGDDSFQLFRCRECDCCRIDGPAMGGGEAYDQYYSSESAKRLAGIFDVLWRLKRQSRARLIRRHAPPFARVCDIGCERGELLNLLQIGGCTVVGTQLSLAAAEFARTHFGIDVYVGELMDAPFASQTFDVIVMLNVLEHLPDPRQYLEQAARMLASGGVLWIEVPNVSSLTARWSGKRWLHHDPRHHMWGFNTTAITRLLGEYGFTVDRTYRYNWEHGPIGTLQSALNALPGPANVIFGIVSNGLSRRPRMLAIQLAHIALSVVLLPLSVVVAAFEGLTGKPQVVLLRAIKGHRV